MDVNTILLAKIECLKAAMKHSWTIDDIIKNYNKLIDSLKLANY